MISSVARSDSFAGSGAGPEAFLRPPEKPASPDVTDRTAANPTTGGAESLLDVRSLVAAQGPGEDGGKSGNPGGGDPSNPRNLTPEEQRVVEELKKTDREVHAHERAHQAASGGLAGAASFQYTQGPDGKRYAVSGEVSIDASPAATPEATIAKMEQVKRAALAPQKPSAKDRQVATQAEQAKRQAEAELRTEKEKEAQESQKAREEKTEQTTGERGQNVTPLAADLTRAFQAFAAASSLRPGTGSQSRAVVV